MLAAGIPTAIWGFVTRAESVEAAEPSDEPDDTTTAPELSVAPTGGSLSWSF